MWQGGSEYSQDRAPEQRSVANWRVHDPLGPERGVLRGSGDCASAAGDPSRASKDRPLSCPESGGTPGETGTQPLEPWRSLAVLGRSSEMPNQPWVWINDGKHKLEIERFVIKEPSVERLGAAVPGLATATDHRPPAAHARGQ